MEKRLVCQKCGKLLMKLYIPEKKEKETKIKKLVKIEIKCYHGKCKTLNVFNLIG